MDGKMNCSWKLKLVSLNIFLSLIVLGCKEELPYQETFKNKVVENAGVEPIIESLTIDDRLDSSVLKNYYLRELNQQKEKNKESAKLEYEDYKEKYDRSVKHDGKRMADAVYLQRLTYFKNAYDEVLNDTNDSIRYDFYYERLKYSTVFEEITVRFRLSKDGALLVNRYRADIFKGDTSFYELKVGRTIADYIK